MSDLQASQKVMKHYLSALLTDDVVDTPIQEAKKQQLNELLAPVSAPVKAPAVAKPAVVAPVTAPVVKAPVAAPVTPVVEKAQVAAVAPAVPVAAPVVKDYRKGRFQALFFTVAGLKVALPLKALGGIHKMMPVKSLPGQPEWLQGVMLYREQKN